MQERESSKGMRQGRGAHRDRSHKQGTQIMSASCSGLARLLWRLLLRGHVPPRVQQRLRALRRIGRCIKWQAGKQRLQRLPPHQRRRLLLDAVALRGGSSLGRCLRRRNLQEGLEGGCGGAARIPRLPAGRRSDVRRAGGHGGCSAVRASGGAQALGLRQDQAEGSFCAA